jgi:hypothetical protein
LPIGEPLAVLLVRGRQRRDAMTAVRAADGKREYEPAVYMSFAVDWPMRLQQAALLAVALAVLAVEPAAEVGAESIGRASMPSSVAQYFGYGYGAGRHAAIVRTPGMHGPHMPRNVRVPRYVGPLYPAPYAPVRCYGEACYPTETPAAVPEPVPMPDVMPAPVTAPAPDRQVWRRNF